MNPLARQAGAISSLWRIGRRRAFRFARQDAIELGIAPGPALGELLREMERWWIEGDFRADRKACLAELKRRVSGAPHL